MRAVVVYESMYGNTRKVAEAVAEGLGGADDSVLSVGDALRQPVLTVDVLVVGAPTHAWGMSRPSTRKSAMDAAAKPDSVLVREPGADGIGVREWLEQLQWTAGSVAVFDTRIQVPLGLSGSAARKIARKLRSSGYRMTAAPESFYVTRENALVDGELQRAKSWGARVNALADARGA
jgi:hypothetical protein